MPTDALAVALAQVNPSVGDLAGNVALVRRARAEGAAAGADLVVLPELVIVGYPPEDLVLRPAFVRACREMVEELARDTLKPGPAMIVSCPWEVDGRLHNAAILLEAGGMTPRFKHELPNYGVFDEKRVFVPGPLPDAVAFRGFRLGLPICEDMWTPAVTRHLGAQGVDLMIVPNGSPFEVDKPDARLRLARERVAESGVPLVYVNQVGGQDELVFDGASFALDASGAVVASLPPWREVMYLVRWHRAGDGLACSDRVEPKADERAASIYQAMVLGLRDYVRKNRFPGVVLGLSGGIDSALSAAVAVDALGPGRVIGVRLPSRYTSALSQDDAETCARALGIRLETIAVAQTVREAEAALAAVFAGREADVTEENLQARVRGLLLMAISNKFGHMVLTTGNKSEMSVGYATLYGDMCGGYSVLKDVYKTDVYHLAHWRNGCVPDTGLGPAGMVIPASTIERPPTAELRPGQTDQDSLPPYDVLDGILRGLVEEERGIDDIAAAGYPLDLVRRIQHLLFTAEYKRRQAPPGVKITRRSFGRDRRYPITNAFRDVRTPVEKA